MAGSVGRRSHRPSLDELTRLSSSCLACASSGGWGPRLRLFLTASCQDLVDSAWEGNPEYSGCCEYSLPSFERWLHG